MRIDWAGWRSATGLGWLAAALAMVAGTGAAWAQVGQPQPWQMDMQAPITALGREVWTFHTALVWMIVAICVFVLFLLLWVIFRFNEKANPTPSRTTHNTLIEIAWTVVPILILVGISVPSFRILRDQLTIPKPDVVVKAIGHAWYWAYEYPADQGGFRFESNMLEDAEAAKANKPRLLAVDNEMVVPVNKVVKLQVTAADVLHSFGVPSIGFTLDAVPGRLNEAWFKAEREGVYYGQCRELCGARHAFMPIAIRVVNQEQYDAWVADAKTKFARIDGGRQLADAAR